MSDKRDSKKQEIVSLEEDIPYYEYAWNEISTGTTNNGIWAKAFADCDANVNKTKAAYLRARVTQLKKAKARKLEQEAAKEIEKDRPRREISTEIRRREVLSKKEESLIIYRLPDGTFRVRSRKYYDLDTAIDFILLMDGEDVRDRIEVIDEYIPNSSVDTNILNKESTSSDEQDNQKNIQDPNRGHEKKGDPYDWRTAKQAMGKQGQKDKQGKKDKQGEPYDWRAAKESMSTSNVAIPHSPLPSRKKISIDAKLGLSLVVLLVGLFVYLFLREVGFGEYIATGIELVILIYIWTR